jgi:hypothetical protein
MCVHEHHTHPRSAAPPSPRSGQGGRVGRLAPPVLCPPENSQRVWVALGGHETCPRPVPGGLAWRGTVAAARVACASVLSGRRPRRGVLSLRVYRAVELVSGPGSPRTGVHGGGSWGIVLACCPCRRNYPWSLRARKIVWALGTILRAGYCCCVRADQIRLPLFVPRAASPCRFPGKGVVVHGQDEEQAGVTAGARRCRRGGDR